MNDENVYWDWRAMQRDGLYPSILAIGDSWFWYPFPGGSLITRLGRLVARKQHTVLVLGNNGAEAFDYVEGKYRKAVREALRLHGSALSAVFISGGGNDFAGFNDLRPLLNDDCAQATTAAACFRTGASSGTLDWLMDKMMASYRTLIGQIMASTPPGTHILLHNYDYARPSGRGVFGKKSAWLKPALDNARVPAALQQACINYLIDRFSAELQAMVAIDPARIWRVDSVGTLADKHWANELHPKSSGFRKIATTCWRPVLRRLGLA
ncbi:SGNH/GDSL hydrolase family protein [Denitromonas sp.]|uniref:SGNH/GDSL hydrolase family protein n=1 Tax=Denitromonas sp. TaxID=2734609 RepID=UPI003A85664B